MRNKVTSSWVKRVPKTKKPVTAHSMEALLERRYETPRRCTEKMFLAKPELKSSHTVSYTHLAEAFNITTYGYGHGCGLSQYGAWGYAANGWGYADILAHYFPGTTLESR